MCSKPKVELTNEAIALTVNGSTVTVTTDDWNLITAMIHQHDSGEGRLGELFRHPVTPAKWGRKA